MNDKVRSRFLPGKRLLEKLIMWTADLLHLSKQTLYTKYISGSWRGGSNKGSKNRMVKQMKKMPLWGKIALGLILGVVTGAVFGKGAVQLQPLGDMFINAIKMLIVPLIFSSLIAGMTSLKDLKKLGRIGGKTVLIFLVTSVLAIVLGILLSNIIRPGVGVSLAGATREMNLPHPSSQDSPLKTTLMNLIPSNPIKAMADGNVLQIIVFAILFGVTINLVGDQGKPVQKFFESLAEIMYKMTGIIMEVAPIGVFALMAAVVGQYGLEFLLPLVKVVLTMYFISLVHIVVVFGGALILVARLNPIRFLKGFLDAIVLAYSTSSSSAALPVSMRCCQENLGVPEDAASLVLPLGATINMNGTAIYQGICAVFLAQAYGIELSLANYATMIMTAILASVGTAGIPGAGLIMLSMVLSSVGIPLEGIALVAGIDRILDMVRSTVNVTGDALAAVLVSTSENELDLTCYNGKAKE